MLQGKNVVRASLGAQYSVLEHVLGKATEEDDVKCAKELVGDYVVLFKRADQTTGRQIQRDDLVLLFC